ncbi:MAG: methyltransferase domain-containing protein [Myxococcales bacterium]|nr:methyltransferase domain-containing protein [Myxococcales bacterium]
MHKKLPYTVRFNESNQEVVLSGAVRPRDADDFKVIARCVEEAAANLSGTFYLNLKRLRHLNHTGFVELARCLLRVRARQPTLAIKVIITSVIPWSEARFQFLTELVGDVTAEVYDKDFYPGQAVIENDQLIPCLRTQTNILWAHERKLLPRHGMRPGLKVADICCGIGDFATLVDKEFAPAQIVAVDHSQPFLEYARGVAQEFGLADIDYQRGDASNLLLDDNSFDFVSCRLALQIFDRPEHILQELHRITKPGGRVYLTNEFMSHIYGYPRDANIGWTYRHASEIFAVLGMDLDFGPKMRAYLTDGGFTDIKIDLIEVSNANTDPEDFRRVVASWSDYILGEVASAAGQDEQTKQRMRQGFQDHMYAITHRRGYASWPVCVASGRKPESSG